MTATNTATKATKPIKQPNPLPQPTVADYIVARLAREGITDCFGVAGDFAFNGGLLDAALDRAATVEPACRIEIVAACSEELHDVGLTQRLSGRRPSEHRR